MASTPTPRLSSLSAFFPAYNEEKNLTAVYSALSDVLPRIAGAYEIIIVNDGSRDGTGTIADDLANRDPCLRVVHHESNLGYGAAIRHGIEASRYDYVFFTDGDGQFDVSQLSLLVPFASTYNAVIGYRLNRQDNVLRKLNAWAWNRLVDRMFKLRVKDIDCAFKLFRRDILQGVRLQSTGAMISTEILVRLKRSGWSIKEVGIAHLPRLAGKQTGANPRVILRAFRELRALRKTLDQEER